MPLHTHTLHDGALLRVHCVCCRPDDKACGAEEHTLLNQLALPLSGVFVKHHEDGSQVVASAGQALFFNAQENYRISHPAGSGDDCLVLDLQPETLRELLRAFDAAAAERERRPFEAHHALLPAAASLQRGLFWHGLRSGEAGALEIESRALELCAAALAAARPQAPRAVDRRPQARRRRREQAQAVAVTLAASPDQDWSLDVLARRVHASPYHLCRSFGEELGEPVHRYLLRARLAQALDAVLDSGEELTAIALRLGFATPSHFSAAFRKAYGLTPSALRRKAGPAAVRELRKISTAPGLAAL